MSTVILADTQVVAAAVVLSSIQDYALNAVVQCKCVNPIIPLRAPLTAQLLLSNDAGASYVLADTKRFGVGANDSSYQTFILSNYATQIISTQVTFIGSTAAARTLPGSNQPAQPSWNKYMIRFTGNLGGTVTASGIADVGGGGGGGGGSGTVTTTSVVPANGFDGTVDNATTTPAITLRTTVIGIPKGNGTQFTNAIPGTDYLITLPNPSSSSLGGVQSIAAVGSRWLNAISTSGVPSLTQPAFADLTGLATPAQLPTTGTTVNQHYGTILSVTEVGGNATFNLGASDSFTCTLNANATLLISNPPVSTNQTFRIELVQANSGGPYTVNWFSGIIWFGSGVPTMTTTPGNKMTFKFEQTGIGSFNGYFLGEGGVAAGGGGTPSGTSGQTQYNNAGAFGGYTMSGDATIVASTGIITVSKTGGISFGSLATLGGSTQGTVPYMGASSTPAYLATGTAGSILTTGGAAANPAWSANLAVGTDGNLKFTALSHTSAAGDLWYASSDQGTFSIGRASGQARIGGCIFSCLSCTALASFTGQNTALASPTSVKGSLTIPANTLAVGNVLRWHWTGIWNATGAPSAGAFIMFNAITILQPASTFTLAAQAGSPPCYVSYGYLTIRAIGASATAGGVTQFLFMNPSGSTLPLTCVPGGGTPTDTVTFASNANVVFDLQLSCAVSSASNNFQTKSFALFLEN